MIEAQGLCKNFGSTEAVKDVSFSAGKSGTGEILGILGPNGAGKTTILRMLTGFYLPSGGSVTINGLSTEEQSREVKELIGYLPENNPLYADISPYEYLDFLTQVHLIPKDKKKKTIDSAVEACNLESVRYKKIGTLSKGYKQRTGLAAAVIHNPPILILDEPASGLDPNQTVSLRSLIKNLGKNKTIIFSTHILREAEALCSRLIILNKGRIQAEGLPEGISAAAESCLSSEIDADAPVWEITVKGADQKSIKNAIAILQKNLQKNLQNNSIKVLYDDECSQEENNSQLGLKLKLRIIFSGNTASGEQRPVNDRDCSELIFDWAVSNNLKILEMNRARISLEDAFVRLTGESS